jgi:hypothetical protein
MIFGLGNLKRFYRLLLTLLDISPSTVGFEEVASQAPHQRASTSSGLTTGSISRTRRKTEEIKRYTEPEDNSSEHMDSRNCTKNDKDRALKERKECEVLVAIRMLSAYIRYYEVLLRTMVSSQYWSIDPQDLRAQDSAVRSNASTKLGTWINDLQSFWLDLSALSTVLQAQITVDFGKFPPKLLRCSVHKFQSPVEKIAVLSGLVFNCIRIFQRRQLFVMNVESKCSENGHSSLSADTIMAVSETTVEGTENVPIMSYYQQIVNQINQIPLSCEEALEAVKQAFAEDIQDSFCDFEEWKNTTKAKKAITLGHNVVEKFIGGHVEELKAKTVAVLKQWNRFGSVHTAGYLAYLVRAWLSVILEAFGLGGNEYKKESELSPVADLPGLTKIIASLNQVFFDFLVKMKIEVKSMTAFDGSSDAFAGSKSILCSMIDVCLEDRKEHIHGASSSKDSIERNDDTEALSLLLQNSPVFDQKT